MLKLDLAATERFVEGHPNAFWDGWTMVMFKPTRAGEHNRKGMFRDGQWGIANRVDPDEQGWYRFRA
jgi:hypothetical protein